MPMKSRHFVKLPILVVPFLAFAWCLPATDSKTDEPAKAEKPAADSMLGKEGRQGSRRQQPQDEAHLVPAGVSHDGTGRVPG